MRNRVQARVYGLVAITVVGIAAALLAPKAGAALDVLQIGEPIPEFSLKDLSGKTHTLDQYEDKIVVFNFCTQQCPFSRGADPDINAIAKEYGEKGVVFLGIESNKNLEPADVRPYIEDKGIAYPILDDVGNTFADAVGAKVTPEIYIKGKDGNLVYHGAPDNRAGPTETPTEHYLRDALDALLAGEPIEKPEVKAWGCGLKRET